MTKSELYHDNQLIGTTSDLQIEFLSIRGSLALNHPLAPDIDAYIGFSKLMSEKIEQNTPDYDRFIDEEELKHEALITSTTWILIPHTGEPMRILAPVFHQDNSFSTRLNT